MRSIVLLVAMVTAAAVAMAGHGPQPTDPSGAYVGATESTAAGPLVGDSDEVLLAILPGDSFDLAIRSAGDPLEVVIRLNHGASLGGTLSGPGLCRNEEFTTHVIGLSTSGQVVAWGACGPVASGVHVLHIEGGSSAFLGTVTLVNATFEA